MYFTIKGQIKHIYDIVTRYSTINQFQYFQKRNIIIQCDTELYTICFVDKKIELLKDCIVGSEVELDIKVRGRMWKYKGEINSVNELTCLKLKHCIVEKKVSEIFYKNSNYDLIEYFYKETIMLKLIGREHKEEILLTAVCDFTHNYEKLSYILFSNYSNDDIFKLLQEQKIIEHKYNIHQSGAASGYVCKLLYKTESKPKENQNIFERGNQQYETYIDNDKYDHGIDFSNWNDDLDNDEQSEEFWNQF